MINPTTDAITEFATPHGQRQPCGITAGPTATSGSPRLAGPTKIGQINPATGAITKFPNPSTESRPGITAGPDGNLWFTEDGGARSMVSPPWPRPAWW